MEFSSRHSTCPKATVQPSSERPPRPSKGRVVGHLFQDPSRLHQQHSDVKTRHAACDMNPFLGTSKATDHVCIFPLSSVHRQMASSSPSLSKDLTQSARWAGSGTRSPAHARNGALRPVEMRQRWGAPPGQWEGNVQFRCLMRSRPWREPPSTGHSFTYGRLLPSHPGGGQSDSGKKVHMGPDLSSAARCCPPKL